MTRNRRIAALKARRQRKVLPALFVIAMLAGGSALAMAKAQPIAAGSVKSASGVQTSYKVYEGTEGGHVKMVLPASILDPEARGNVQVKFDTSECVLHDGNLIMAVGQQTSYKGIDAFNAPFYALLLIDGEPDVRLTGAETQETADFLCSLTSGQEVLDLFPPGFLEAGFAVVNGNVIVR